MHINPQAMQSHCILLLNTLNHGDSSWRYRRLRLAICMSVALSELQLVEHDRCVLPADLTPHSTQIIFHPAEDLTSLVLVRIAIEPKKRRSYIPPSTQRKFFALSPHLPGHACPACHPKSQPRSRALVLRKWTSMCNLQKAQ